MAFGAFSTGTPVAAEPAVRRRSPIALFLLLPGALYLSLFFLVPLAVVFGISLATKQFGQPPYSELLTNDGGTVQLTLHLSNPYGSNAHHMIEACFKAFARAFREAVSIDPDETGVPSTKGTLTD